ncbi:MAG: isocitrate lyase/PEP mutase family protein [Rhodospirillaceae bacterium]|jgi:2-methylisocitrate lyase-like PEP mutase family enzyme
MVERTTTRLRKLLKQNDIITAPGVFDALTGQIAARQGFDVLYMGGTATTAVVLGSPDVGITTMDEMVDHAAGIVAATGLPLVADADNGYGNALNVRRAVRAFERAGVAGVHIEDQQSPKRCGLLAGKALISLEEMLSKVKSALDARTDPDFLVIARTDAAHIDTFDEAMDRCHAFEEAGADMLFIVPPLTVEQIQSLKGRFNIPLMFHRDSSGRSPDMDIKELADCGHKLVIYPTALMFAAMKACGAVLEEVYNTGSLGGVMDQLSTFEDLEKVVEWDKVRALEEQYDAMAR